MISNCTVKVSGVKKEKKARTRKERHKAREPSVAFEWRPKVRSTLNLARMSDDTQEKEGRERMNAEVKYNESRAHKKRNNKIQSDNNNVKTASRNDKQTKWDKVEQWLKQE
jgi:hypothetical protein